MKTIIVTGTLAYDYIFDFPNYFSNYILPDKVHQINISLLTEHYQKSYGGTAGNQAFYLSKLGQPNYIFAVGGNDFSEYKKFLSKHKMSDDLIKVVKKTHTAAGFAITDKRDNQIWMYSKGALKYAQNLTIQPLLKKFSPLFVLITPNDPQAYVNFVDECARDKIDFAFDIGFNIPITPKETIVKGVKSASIIFGNDYEIELIEKKTGVSLKKNLMPNQFLVTTFADRGSEVYRGGKAVKIGIYKTKAIDPTGAGDAYRAGFLYGLLQGHTVKICGWMGAVAASFAVESKGAMNLRFSKKLFENRLKTVLD